MSAKIIKLLFSYILISLMFNSLTAQEKIYLWTGDVPMATGPKSDPVISDNVERGVTRIAGVSNPSLTLFLPEKEKANGAAIVICPGGGYNILAIDLEGYEIAQWFSNRGFTAFVLQYRVPKQREAALADVQRALRLVRYNAREYNIDPTKIGVMGFSAGGSLSARASTLYKEESYAPTDNADSVSARPDFAILIYPAYLDQGENNSLTPELKVNSSTPPMFMFVAADDKYANSSLVMTAALREAGVPVETHIYPVGGHGFGMRSGNKGGITWPGLAEKWLNDFILFN